MLISQHKYDPMSTDLQDRLRIRSLQFSEGHACLLLHLSNGAVLAVPISKYHKLSTASATQLEDHYLIGSGSGIHWPQLDEDLSLEGLLTA